MAHKDLPLAKVYQLIEPGPVVLLSTAQQGRANVMAMSWHMMMDFEPPLIGCVVSSANHSFTALGKTRMCVIAIPDVGMASIVVAAGNCSGREVDKIAQLGLATMAAEQVAPPLIAACFANLECKVVDTRLMRRHNLFVLEVVKAWIDTKHRHPKTIHHQGYGKFIVDGQAIKLKSHMP